MGKTGNYISTRIGRAIADYKLIEDKDRILVAVSGGKDSLTMLHLLNERRKWAPVSYELVAMHVETDYKCGAANRNRLKKFFEKRGVEYHFEKLAIRRPGEDPGCFWCSWNRRKSLFLAADRFGCNKVALGHNKDDIVETLLLNIFYHGEFSAMNPRQELFGGKIVIIRPLCYVEEKHLARYAKECRFPVDARNCLAAEASRRRLMKEFVKKVEKDCAYVKTNIFRCIARVKKDYINIL
ncbi:MAG: hypothetical protein NC938_02300 [Candidatus Omnitrophica bacterium]|nr:hypothetical protein [Candidatus Omnitrophota bacterium]